MKQIRLLALAIAGIGMFALGLYGWKAYGSSILLDMAANGLSWCF